MDAVVFCFLRDGFGWKLLVFVVCAILSRGFSAVLHKYIALYEFYAVCCCVYHQRPRMPKETSCHTTILVDVFIGMINVRCFPRVNLCHKNSFTWGVD